MEAAARRAAPKKRILFFAEAVTLAHVGRMVALAGALNPDRFEVALACDGRYDGLLGQLPFSRRPLFTVSTGHFLKALSAGKNPYAGGVLDRYVDADLKVINEFRPDLVIGDFRLSLVASAKMANVPYVNVVNAFWSPHVNVDWQIPAHPAVGVFGYRAVQLVFMATRRLFLYNFARPFRKFIRTYHANPKLGRIQNFYTSGDYVLYPDSPVLVPTESIPKNHFYLGPLVWSSKAPRPAWWGRLDLSRPVVYVSLGTSGRGELLPIVLRALAGMNVQVIAATIGNSGIGELPGNVFASDFIPAGEATGISSLIICNGGSGHINQALINGVPVLGIADNLDQYLCMSFVKRLGLGRLVRSDQVTEARIRGEADRLLNDMAYISQAQKLRDAAKGIEPEVVFREFIERVMTEA